MKRLIIRIIQTFLIFILINSISVISVFACTVFNKSTDTGVLFGNVENEQNHYIAELHFVSPDDATGPYGHFYIYYNGNIAGGMNDQGLCFDVAALPPRNAYTGQPHGDLMAYLLNNCATVTEALAFFSSYYWPGHNLNHLMVMDKTGASVVVELIGSQYYMFHKQGASQVMTNYSLADPEIRYGDYPCLRFETAKNMLDTAAVTLDNFQKVCQTVSHAYYDALYSNIYDPDALDIHFFNANINWSERTTLNLIDEYNKGTHYYILQYNQIQLGKNDFTYRPFTISKNSPNPFSAATSFKLKLADEAFVSISILNARGRLIETIENEKKRMGSYSYTWDSGSYPSGNYFCRMQVDGIVETRKWIKN